MPIHSRLKEDKFSKSNVGGKSPIMNVQKVLMKEIEINMLRYLRNIKEQIIAIGFVIVAGESVYVTMSSDADTLQQTLRTYYLKFGFADGFATVKRATQNLE